MKILLVDDDALLRAAIAKVLEANRYRLDLAEDGQAALDLATTVEYDLILLDVQLPRLNGIQVCQALRKQGYRNPILLMTVSDTPADAVAGFEAGADDYVSKPCASEVLLARIRTLLRRSSAASPTASQPTTTLAWGTVTLNFESGRVTVGDQVISLTATEYNLLELFLRHPNRIFSRSAILDQLWGLEDAPTDRAIVTHIKDLRKRLKAGGLREDLIETIYGMGYRLKPVPPVEVSVPTRTSTVESKIGNKIDQVLKRFRPVLNQQVAVLEQAKTALLAGVLTDELHAAAQQEAHKLAGSLATFGYPEGSKLARSLEHLLITHTAFSPETITQVAEWVTALQQTLAHPPLLQTAPPIAAAIQVHVLVIDDDGALTGRLVAESSAWGVAMQVVANPTEARCRLSQTRLDVILLDLSFPGAQEDGLSLLQEIHQQSPTLPVIVLTGRDSLADRLAVSRSGARQFLHKPASTEQIFRAIAQAIATPPTCEAKVLILDDDPAVLTVLSSMLTPWGLEVVTLNDPRQFWEVLVKTSPDIVLLDLEMPDVSGLELCQVVRQDAQWGDLPILVVTAHTDADSLQQAFASGADDFISKPVLGPELVTRVLSRIERTRGRQTLGTPQANRSGR